MAQKVVAGSVALLGEENQDFHLFGLL